MILPLEQQVCSLESAKRLKELGFPQESLFYWMEVPTKNTYWTLVFRGENHPPRLDYYSAYTVAELGELLPKDIVIHKMEKEWDIQFIDFNSDENVGFRSTNEADGRAKMLIYLKENHLL